MKILFADKFPAAYMAQIEALGHECKSSPDLNGDDLPSAIGDAEALIVRSTQVTAATVAAGESLKLVIRAGAGTNTIDKKAAAGKGIHVCNVPGKNAVAVAELAMGLLLAIDRNIPDNVADLRAGKWNKKRYSAALGLHGRKIGIVGLGAIGMAMATRAHAFGMKVHVIGKPGRSAAATAALAAVSAVKVADLEALAESCDILSFHVPAAPQTQGMVGAKLLERVRPGTVIINTSRGDVIDEAALLEALEAKNLRAGLDVYAGEPAGAEAEFSSALAQHPKVYGTHHIGASTEQAQNAVAEGVVEILTAWADGKVLYCVNQPVKPAA